LPKAELISGRNAALAAVHTSRFLQEIAMSQSDGRGLLISKSNAETPLYRDLPGEAKRPRFPARDRQIAA
jgi:hypothetical protein